MTYLGIGAQVVLCVVFVVAVTGKVRSRAAYAEFRDSLTGLGWATSGVRSVLAAGVVVAELAVCVLVAVPITTTWGFAAAAALLVAFTASVARAISQGRRVRCRCFGSGGGTMGRGHLARNGVLSAVAVLGAVASGAATGQAVEPAGVVAAVGVAGLAAVVFTRWDDLAFLVSPRHLSHTRPIEDDGHRRRRS